MVAGLLALMLFYIVTGLPKVDSRHFLPFAPHGWNPVLATAGIVFISYGGLLKIAAVAEEIKNPGKVIPLSIIFSLIITTLLYTLMVFVTTGVLRSELLDHSLTPISTGAQAFLGYPGLVMLSLAAVLAFVSTANAGIMSASRYLMSLGRDNLIPRLFGTVSTRFGTPHIAIMTTGICVIGALFLKLEILVKAASTVLILTYILSNVCLIILRESRLGNYQPKFKVPLYPFLPIVGTMGYVLLLFEMGTQALLISVVLIAAGLLFYVFFGRIRSQSEYALLHLVERLSDREFTKGMLESELKAIIRERDDLCFDTFDEIVEKAIIIDCPGPMSEAELFSLVSQSLGERFQLNQDTVRNTLEKRSQEGSIILIPGVAVSDIICTGDDMFEMVLIRCREGVLLDKEDTPVNAYIVLLTTRDKRDFYLKAVASIAQIIQHGDFEKRWGEARTEQQLRDIILLGERRRICKQ
jgi:mannitol/fructose-specific phosphotransferase system IIA component (Ntr-type)